MTTHKPAIGRIVHYKLSQQDADAINRRRADAKKHLDYHRANADGGQLHVGNQVAAGEIYPMIITRVWGSLPESAVNGQLLLDGNDVYWVTSATHGDGERGFTWPERV